MASLPRVQPPSLCAVRIFHWTLQYFCILQGYDSCFGFITFHARWYFIELCNILLQSQLRDKHKKRFFLLSEPTTSTQARMPFSRMGPTSGLLTNPLAETDKAYPGFGMFFFSSQIANFAPKPRKFFLRKWKNRQKLKTICQILTNLATSCFIGLLCQYFHVGRKNWQNIIFLKISKSQTNFLLFSPDFCLIFKR